MYQVTREIMEVKFSDYEEADSFKSGMESKGWQLMDSSYNEGEDLPVLYSFDKWHV